MYDPLVLCLRGTAVGTSNQIHRNCPFCSAGFTEIIEIQQDVAIHLVRLALFGFAPVIRQWLPQRKNQRSRSSSNSMTKTIIYHC